MGSDSDLSIGPPCSTVEVMLVPVDGKKNIFKLAQGEYVAAEVLESTYSESPFISQIFVHGDSTHSFLIAIVFVHEPGAVEWAKQHGFGNATLEQLCDSKDFNGAVVADLNRVHALNGLKGFERILGVILYWEEFNTLNDL